jgi:hypothetical protein
MIRLAGSDALSDARSIDSASAVAAVRRACAWPSACKIAACFDQDERDKDQEG